MSKYEYVIKEQIPFPIEFDGDVYERRYSVQVKGRYMYTDLGYFEDVSSAQEYIKQRGAHRGGQNV